MIEATQPKTPLEMLTEQLSKSSGKDAERHVASALHIGIQIFGYIYHATIDVAQHKAGYGHVTIETARPGEEESSNPFLQRGIGSRGLHDALRKAFHFDENAYLSGVPNVKLYYKSEKALNETLHKAYSVTRATVTLHTHNL